ncbi:hypothetical protein LguiB_006707 [Lonicera macranthoides]
MDVKILCLQLDKLYISHTDFKDFSGDLVSQILSMKVGLVHLLLGLALQDEHRLNVRAQPEKEGRTSSQGASSSSPFASYKDDDKHISKMKMTHKGGLFYIRLTFHVTNAMYRNISLNLEVQILLENTGLCNLFKRQMLNSDRTIIEMCYRRWWDTIHTYHLPTYELCFTPLNFTMLTEFTYTDKSSKISKEGFLEGSKRMNHQHRANHKGTRGSSCQRTMA